MKVLQNLASL